MGRRIWTTLLFFTIIIVIWIVWIFLTLDGESFTDDLSTTKSIVSNLKPPSSEPYNLKDNKTDYSQNGQSAFIDHLLHHKRAGVFIEAGAYDGEDMSNSLFFERERGWSGLLIEPDPWNHYSMMKKHRKAYTIHACISTNAYPTQVRFKQSDAMGRIAREEETKGIFTTVSCFPLHSFMRSINHTYIDALFLDIEGSELQVLKTVPWSQVSIKIISVEYVHNPEQGNGLKRYLHQQGYTHIKTIGYDFIFTNNNIK